MAEQAEKILISACLLGLAVRYDGVSKQLAHMQIKCWQQQGRLITICPEVTGGLAIPRPPAEQQLNDQTRQIQVATKQGQDVSAAFQAGAQHALYLCQQHNIHFALLKEFSPSCGSTQVYDGSFSGHKIAGQGVTAKLLQQHDIKVFSELNIEALIKRVG